MKECSNCNTIKSLKEFSIDVRVKSGYAYSCKECVSEKRAITYEIRANLYNKRTKEQAFLQDFIFIYNPKFFSEESQIEALIDPLEYNIPYLFEKTMNMLSGFTKTDKINDVNDAFKDGIFMEWKTGGVSPMGSARIPGVQSKKSGKFKEAPIVAALYNTISDKIDFFFIPKEKIIELVTISDGSIMGTYSINSGYKPKLRDYYVETIEEILELIKQKTLILEN
jgi:hypothetical protein